MWRWGTPQNFCLGFIDNFEKTNIYLKNCWSRLIKNVRTLIFTRLYFFFFQKIRKNTQKDKDIIIFTQVSKNHDHMLYCSWDMASDGYNCYSWFWAILCPFTPLVSFFFLKMKKPLERPSFYTSVPKIMIICFTVPEIWHRTDVIIFHLGLFFALLPSPLTAQKLKIVKK